MSKVQDILKDVILTMPYNNAEVLFEKEQGRRIRTFGGSCRHQLEEIASRTNAQGIRMDFLGAGNSTHHIGIALEKSEMLVVDPAMRQRDPLSLTRMFDDVRSQMSRAYPETKDALANIAITQTGPRTFCEKVQMFSDGEPVSSGRISTFDLSHLKNDLPDVDFDMRTTIEAVNHKLFLLGVCPDGSVVNVQMDMKGRLTARLHGNPPTHNAPSLDDLLRKVTEPIGSQPDSLTDYLSEARKILEKLLK